MPNWSFFRWGSSRTRTRKVGPYIPEQATEETMIAIPESQTVLLLHAPKQSYQVTPGYEIPQIEKQDELLVRVRVIGLNPIDWKAPDFNFGIPTLPYISGREFAGEVVTKPSKDSRLKIGDKVIVISTDYRDLRKAAYQEYAVAADFNVVRIPSHISLQEGSTIGVAFVAAVLALGVCMGVDFSSVHDGPDLLNLLQSMDPESLPEDIRAECLAGIQPNDRAKPGDWLAIWGGSATSANLTIQLARLAGLKVVAVVDKAKHGLRLSNHKIIRPNLLVDSHDPQRAIDIIRANVKGQLRFGIDTRGRDSAASLLQTLTPGHLVKSQETTLEVAPPTPPGTPHGALLSAHLIGLTGLPKGAPPEGTVFHTVPIKLFHEVPSVGMALVTWLERLLQNGLVYPPEIIDVEDGFTSINSALDRMRDGEISGGKLVLKVA